MRHSSDGMRRVSTETKQKCVERHEVTILRKSQSNDITEATVKACGIRLQLEHMK